MKATTHIHKEERDQRVSRLEKEQEMLLQRIGLSEYTSPRSFIRKKKLSLETLLSCLVYYSLTKAHFLINLDLL